MVIISFYDMINQCPRTPVSMTHKQITMRCHI